MDNIDHNPTSVTLLRNKLYVTVDTKAVTRDELLRLAAEQAQHAATFRTCNGHSRACDAFNLLDPQSCSIRAKWHAARASALYIMAAERT